ncbi:hypothetical protein F5Y06DRAFT_193605 [Hypoxylon sp. FL0890]|nr:hypothetical protein F5Y06DRAFT_193605 [Hypoxylon sp. FL0890]
MFVFDFPDVSGAAAMKACSSIGEGLDFLFEMYPFLTGRVGPLCHPVKRNLVQLRYSSIARYNIFKWMNVDNRTCYDYRELCKAGMPVSHWNKSEFCAAPSSHKLSDWPPAFTLQVNCLETGALILCFAFHNSIMDEWSIPLLLARFAAGTRGHGRGLISVGRIQGSRYLRVYRFWCHRGIRESPGAENQRLER